MASGPPRPLTTNETRSLPACGVRVRRRSPTIAKVSGQPHFPFAVDIAVNRTLHFLAAHFSTPHFTDRINVSFSRSRAHAKRDITVLIGTPDRETTCLHQVSKQAFLRALVYNAPRPNLSFSACSGQSGFAVKIDSLEGITLAFAKPRDLDSVSQLIVRGLPKEADTAHTRVWMVRLGDIFTSCQMQSLGLGAANYYGPF